jgi:hypothetical protein
MSGVHLPTFGVSPTGQTAELGQDIPNQVSHGPAGILGPPDGTDGYIGHWSFGK